MSAKSQPKSTKRCSNKGLRPLSPRPCNRLWLRGSPGGALDGPVRPWGLVGPWGALGDPCGWPGALGGPGPPPYFPPVLRCGQDFRVCIRGFPPGGHVWPAGFFQFFQLFFLLRNCAKWAPRGPVALFSLTFEFLGGPGPPPWGALGAKNTRKIEPP